MKEIYKGYEIDHQLNDWGFYEADNVNDCDADVLTSKTIEALKIEID